MKTRELNIDLYLTIAEFVVMANLYRERVGVKWSLYLDLYGSLWFNPTQFHHYDTQPKTYVMIHNCIHHNDNHL